MKTNQNKLASILARIIALSAILFIAFAIYSSYVFNKVKITGNLYKQIIQSKDLIADILPPPEYILESYLTCLQMLGTQNSKALDELIQYSQRLKSDYLSRHQFWTDDLQQEKMKGNLCKKEWIYSKVKGEKIK